MLRHIQSNRMEILSEELSKLLRETTNQSPLISEQILVQSPGMATWLRLEIAKHNQIAAGLTFPLPSSFIWQLCYLLLDDVPQENPFTKPAMTWKIMAILPDLLDEEGFQPLKRYLTVQTQQEVQGYSVKLYQLASRIADVFDQYLVYRPDWILAWEKEDIPLELSFDQLWQPVLWRALVDYNAKTLHQSHYHRANLHQTLIARLTLSDATAELPSRLFIFGISALPPQTLDVLAALAHQIDVFFFSLSPCRHYWGDIMTEQARARMALAYTGKKHLPEDWEATLEVGNPLLANNGKLGRELLDMILELPPENIEMYDNFSEPKFDTLLCSIQGDILEMNTLDQSLTANAEQYLNLPKRRILAKDDTSITFRSCHSPLREVETLHDHLLHMLTQHSQLEAKDIVVMMPDVAAYAPYIDAVFAAKSGAHFIPYAIADRGAAQESPLVNSFLNLIEISLSRYALSEVMSILEVPAIMAKFDINDDELAQIKVWLDEAGIRWGRDQQSRNEQGLANFDKYSWEFGIRRILLGYAMGDNTALYQEDLPLAGIEGQSAQAVGKLLNLIEALDSTRHQLNKVADANQWTEQLINLINHFYQINPQDTKAQAELDEIQQYISQFNDEVNQAGFNQALGLKVVSQWFTNKLTESRVGQRYLAGSVNFCTLMPMRSIPFKLVCLLGMNDGQYPRVNYPVGFDLTSHYEPRRGDRSRRLDDRYLFLEALLSARQQLYISYIGHSQRDNTERIPSMLVSELIEYCQLCYKPEDFPSSEPTQDKQYLAEQGELAAKALTNQLCITQPLQPFDSRLFSEQRSSDQQDLPRSYASQWCPQNSPQQQGLTFIAEPIITNESLNNSEVSLKDLIRFYRNPAQYFCRHSLKLNLSLEMDMQDDDEPFELNSLQRYQLQALLIDHLLLAEKKSDTDELAKQLAANGQLPMSPFDNLLFRQTIKDVSPLVERSQFMRAQQSAPEAIDISIKLAINSPHLNFQTVALLGYIEHFYAKGLIIIRPGSAKAKDILACYIKHLCLSAMGHNKISYLLDMKNFHAFYPIDTHQAKSLLAEFVTQFYQGLVQPLTFFPNLSYKLVTMENSDQLSLEEQISELTDEWLPNNGFGEGSDPHNARIFSFPDDFLGDDNQSFSVLANTLIKPMISLYKTDALDELANFVAGDR